MGRQVAGVDAPAGQRRVHVLVFVEVDQFDPIQAMGLEQALIFGDVPLAVTQPGLDAELEGAGFWRQVGRQRGRLGLAGQQAKTGSDQ
ncbi:hypothetical protein D3C77_652780 [compost metagenome]